MNYIIMADGQGQRWNNFGGVPKHFAKVGGETLIGRTVRLLKENCPGSEIIITSHDPRYDIPGTVRHEPLNNHTEVDRFTEELIEDDVCFLYGDTWYSEESMQMILQHLSPAVTFFGRGSDIAAVKVKNGAMFREKVNEARQILRIQGRTRNIGLWLFQNLESAEYIGIDDNTRNVNSPEDYFRLLAHAEAYAEQRLSETEAGAETLVLHREEPADGDGVRIAQSLSAAAVNL